MNENRMQETKLTNFESSESWFRFGKAFGTEVEEALRSSDPKG